MPVVSICLTTYNREAVLRDTIDSILLQTFSDFELIISDDNSTDNTREICEEYVKQDSRVKYFRNNENLRMPGNLNAAISNASSDFIANLHDGDIYRSDLIEKWYNTLKRHPDALFVFNQYQMVDKENKKLTLIDHKLDEVNDGTCLFEYFFKNLTSAPWGTVMARKEAYLNFGLFDSGYEFISDVEMWLRLGSHGKVCYVKEPLNELTPRELTHKYYLPHWRITYLNLSILYRYYKMETAGIPSAVIKKNIKIHLSRSILILIKHFSIKRAREYLYMVFSSPFTKMKILFLPFVLLIPFKPTGFDVKEWKKTCALKQIES